MIEQLETGLLRLCAPNPAPMTAEGTNSYILGKNEFVLIDPGPEDRTHLARLQAFFAQNGPLRAIMVTHSHLDHSPLARPLASATGAEIFAFGDSRAGRSEGMEALAKAGASGGGEGVDLAFRPDHCLADGESLALEGESIRAIWTPGHFGNHLCFRWRDVVFSGDHVMGWASTLVSPPDGDMGAYMASLDRLEAEQAQRLYPGHGAPVIHPAQRIAALRAHRQDRAATILSYLAEKPQTIPALVARIYADTPPALHSAARRNVFAHLIEMASKSQITATPTLHPDALFSATATE
jgi:glyoxylase-like metal-dependent hydrolase (beta-lactamase superfamily II)